MEDHVSKIGEGGGCEDSIELFLFMIYLIMSAAETIWY
jgi:hypothetical protein